MKRNSLSLARIIVSVAVIGVAAIPADSKDCGYINSPTILDTSACGSAIAFCNTYTCYQLSAFGDMEQTTPLYIYCEKANPIDGCVTTSTQYSVAYVFKATANCELQGVVVTDCVCPTANLSTPVYDKTINGPYEKGYDSCPAG